MAAPACPSDEQLERLLLGKTNAEDEARLREHLLHCHACEDRASSLLAVDRLVENVQAGMRLSDPVEADLAALLRNASGWSSVAPETPQTSAEQTQLGPADAAAKRVELSVSLNDPTKISELAVGSSWAARAVAELSGASVNSSSQPGDLGRVGAFRILSVLGQGGMGLVFLAEDTGLQRLVALKAMKAGEHSSAAIGRFLREARAAARFQHPNLVTVFAVGQEGETPYISMELLKGPDLENRVRTGGPLNSRDAAEAIRHAARGLQHAHSRGVIHRDVKPSNLMYAEDGVVKVLDLGVARISPEVLDDSRAASEATHRGMVVGTLNYMAPEQALDATSVDERADVFALGGVLHFLLMGRPPFVGSAKSAVILEGQAPSPGQLPADCPPALADLLAKMIAVKPSKRSRDMSEVIAALDSILQNPSVRPVEKRADPAVVPTPRRRGVASAIAAALAVVAAIGLVVALARPDVGQRAPSAANGPSPGSNSARGPSAALAPTASAWGSAVPARIASPPTTSTVTGPPLAGTPPRPATWPLSQRTIQIHGPCPAPTDVPGVSRWQVLPRAPDALVSGVTWNPNGRTILCATPDNLRLYDSKTLELVDFAETLENIVMYGWNRDGSRLAVHYYSGRVDVFDEGLRLRATIGDPSAHTYTPCSKPQWSRDGKALVYSVQSLGLVKIAEVDDESSARVRTLKVEGDELLGAALSPDGSTIVTGSKSGKVRRWSLAGELLDAFETNTPGATVVSYSPNGEWIAVLATYTEPALKLWKPDGTLGAVASHSSTGYMFWRPDSLAFVTLGFDSMAKVWSIDGRQTHEVACSYIARDGGYSPDGKQFAVGGKMMLNVFEPSAEDDSIRVVGEQRGHDAHDLVWTEDGSRLAAGGDEVAVGVWGEDGRVEAHLPAQLDSQIAWSRDGRALAFAEKGKPGVAVWNAETGFGERWAEEGSPHRALTWTPDGQLTVGSVGLLLNWKKPRDVGGAFAFRANRPRLAAWRPDGSRLAAVGEDKSLRIWDGKRQLLVERRTPVGDELYGLAWSRQGDRLATVQKNAIQIWSPDGGPLRTLPLGSLPRAVAWSADDRMLIVGTSSWATLVLDSRDGHEIASWQRMSPFAFGVAGDPRGGRAATLQPSGYVHMHNLNTGAVEWVGVFTEHGAFTFSPAGEMLAGDATLAEQDLVSVAEREPGELEVHKLSKFRTLMEAAFLRRSP